MLRIVSFIFFITCHVFVRTMINSPDDQVSLEILEDGKNQYKLLQERGELPQYGECWKAAIEHIHQSCNYLSEYVQSDIALRITNCFLEMSGHDTYNCDLDKKPNLRSICINSMTDRAFNVYTEFYTHTQNICWFLRGQLWQEKMSDVALRASKQLHMSLEKHQMLLERQNDSLQLQQRLLAHGQSLEVLLNESRSRTQAVMDDIQASTLEHQRLLDSLVKGLAGLQSWLVGEVSWLDSFLFYAGGLFILLAVTCAECTASSRLPLMLVLSGNIFLERTISNIVTGRWVSYETHLLHETIQNYVWWCRRFISVICIFILCVNVYYYKNYSRINNSMLLQIRAQNQRIYEELESIRGLISKNRDYSNENSVFLANEKINDGPPTPVNVSVGTSELLENIEDKSTPSRRHKAEQNHIKSDITSKSHVRYYLRTRS